MTDKKLVTHVAFVIDRSGSMWRTAQQAVDGFNGQLEEVKQNSKDQEIRCSLVTFNSDVYEHLWEAPAEELKAATYDSFKPSGWTAMYDAMGYTIDKLMKTTDPTEEGATYLVFVISDGEENWSKHFKGPQVSNLIKEAESTGQWTISYMGCSQEDLEKVAQETGIRLDNMAAWENKTARGTNRAMNKSRERMRKYFSGKLALADSEDYNGDIAVFKRISTNYQSDAANCSADYTKESNDEQVAGPAIPCGVTNFGGNVDQVQAQSDCVVECSLERTDLFSQGAKADFATYNASSTT